MGSRGTMNEDVSIRYKGDDKDFKKACARVNVELKKQSNLIKTQNTEIEGSYKKASGAAAAMVAVFAVSAIAGFLKKSIEIAKAHGELSDRALETSINMTKIHNTVDNIKGKIGGVILESKLWHFWAEKLKNTFIKPLFFSTCSCNLLTKLIVY